MPKIDLASVPVRKGSGYPEEFAGPLAGRTRRRLGDAGGLEDFGVNLMTLPPGGWSSQRHWHSHEDEFVYVLEGELTLIEDGGATVLRAGDCAAFAKNSGNGHHLKNESSTIAVYLEVGSRSPVDMTTCSDIDMKSSSVDGLFTHKDGTPYFEALFSYGTLQQSNVQLATFGRLLTGRTDALVGFEQSMHAIDDAEVVKTSGKTHHPIVRFTGNGAARVPGTVFEITPQELAQADRYEVAAYKRVSAPLASGGKAWVYVDAKFAPPDEKR